MLRFLSVLFVIVAACSGSHVSPRILGGSDANIADFPYMVSIELNIFTDQHVCGGAIISADWVLTDAWCASEPTNPDDFSVRAGSALLGNGSLHNVVQWIHHPDNNVYDGINDFALVQVDPPFEFGENVAAASLPEPEEGTPDAAEAFITGWGRIISIDENTHDILQFANISSFNEARCSEYLAENFHNSKLCAQDPKGQVAHCYRDEGAPLVIDGKLYGIAQFPGYCAETFEVLLFSRVASARTWIDETIAA